MSFTLILSQIIQPALAACWQWFNSMWDAFNGFAGFFIAIFTMICAIRFFLMPFIGYHRTYARHSAEERPVDYNAQAMWNTAHGVY